MAWYSPLFPNWNRGRQQQQQSARAAQRSQQPAVPDRSQSGVRQQIKNAVTESLGPLGQLIQSLLRPFGQSIINDIDREIDAAEGLINSLAQAPVERVQEQPDRPAYRIGSFQGDDEEPPERPLLEGMIPVTSSNVHSIGYEWHSVRATTGDLLVRFLGGTGKHRSGGGALYRYRDVPREIFRAFKMAASKGVFVWDELRVRGTVSGHQYSYDLEDLGTLSRIPRQAGLKAGRKGEWYLTRRFRGGQSALPERQVRGPHGMLTGWQRRAPQARWRAGRR